MSIFLIVWIGCTFFLAGVVKGVVGLGLPTLSMGLLTLFMMPSVAASALVVPSLVTNVWQMVTGGGLKRVARRFWLFLLTIVLAVPLGIPVLTQGSHGPAEPAMGAVLLIYALMALAAPHWRVPPKAEPWLSPFVGILSGIVTGATGTFVIPVPYLGSLGLEPDDLIQALGLTFTVSTVALAAVLVATDSYPLNAAWLSLGALVPALAGMAFGTFLRRRLDPVVFRRAFFIGLSLLGAAMLARYWL